MCNCLFEFVKVSFKKVACAFDNVDSGVRFNGEFTGERAKFYNIAEFVQVAVNEENWFATAFQKCKVVHVDGRADGDETFDALVCDADFETDTRAERESGKRDRLIRVALNQIIESGACIILFATRLIVCACACADAAKVDAKRCESGVVQGACRAKHDLVVHRAAMQRMRVKNKRRAARVVVSSNSALIVTYRAWLF